MEQRANRRKKPPSDLSLVGTRRDVSSSIELNIQRVASEFTDASCVLVAHNAI